MVYQKPNPDDPNDLAKRLHATDVPINRGIAMILNKLNQGAHYIGFICRSCGVKEEFERPTSLSREQVRRACCGYCGSAQINLQLSEAH